MEEGWREEKKCKKGVSDSQKEKEGREWSKLTGPNKTVALQAKKGSNKLELMFLYCLSRTCSSRMCYYGVFDGHAGPKAAQFAAEHLHKNIVLKFPKGWW